MIGVIRLSCWSWVILHNTKILVYVKVCPMSGLKGKRREPLKVRMGQKHKVSAFSCHLLLDLCLFLRIRVFLDAEHYGEVENVITSCFARQTGKGVFNQLSQPSNFFAPRCGKFFGYDQKGVRGSN